MSSYTEGSPLKRSPRSRELIFNISSEPSDDTVFTTGKRIKYGMSEEREEREERETREEP